MNAAARADIARTSPLPVVTWENMPPAARRILKVALAHLEAHGLAHATRHELIAATVTGTGTSRASCRRGLAWLELHGLMAVGPDCMTVHDQAGELQYGMPIWTTEAIPHPRPWGANKCDWFVQVVHEHPGLTANGYALLIGATAQQTRSYASRCLSEGRVEAFTRPARPGRRAMQHYYPASDERPTLDLEDPPFSCTLATRAREYAELGGPASALVAELLAGLNAAIAAS